MLIAAVSILVSIIVWATKAMATNSETHHRSVNDPLPRYPRLRRKS